MSVALLSASERSYILGGLVEGVRSDGRSRVGVRAVRVETGVVPQANGSARVLVGSTEVVVGLKAELGTPSADAPQLGRLEVSADLSPLAGPGVRSRGGGEAAAEVAAAVAGALAGGRVEGSGVDGATMGVDADDDADSSFAASRLLSQLCIAPGVACWVLYVDVTVVSLDASPALAASAAALAALATARLPEATLETDEETGEPDVELGELTKALDPRPFPVLVTAALAPAGGWALDPTAAEETAAGATLAVAVAGDGAVVGLSTRGEGAVETAALLEAIEAATEAGRKLHAAILDHVDDDAIEVDE